MQVIDEQDVTYYNFINSLDSEYTKKYYKFCLEKFLNHYKIDLASLLKLPEDQLTNLIIKYLVETKISKQYKNLLSASLKHACEINDVMLNWKKIKKFINSEKTGNETNGRDRGYTRDLIILNNVVLLLIMKVEDHIGMIGTCSECNQQKKIGLATDQGRDAKGNEHSLYLKCEGCVTLDLKKDESESRSIT